jgi:hypothetical protein
MRTYLVSVAVLASAAPVAAQQWQFVDGPFAAGTAVVWDFDSSSTSATSPGVFEWNGNDWQARAPVPTASVVGIPFSLCHDPLRQRTVMLGGTELWEWDGCSVSRGADFVNAARSSETRLEPVQMLERAGAANEIRPRPTSTAANRR